jgi:hypothetical protein
MTSGESVADAFRRMGRDFEQGGSPLYARLAREHADDPVLAEIVGDHRPRWDGVLRLFGGVHLLALSGDVEDPWSSFSDVLATYRERLARFVAEQPVQTNEVQRSWALLPAFLTVAGERPLDLVELGPSAGLNLLWDRYRYRYGDLAWGDPGAQLELSGQARGGPPAELLARTVDVRSRLGIDRAPVDVARGEETRLLEAFVWADQAERRERLRRALALARREPPKLVQGDYRDVLSEVLARRPADGLTVVFHSASVAYMKRDDRERLGAAIEAAGRERSLAWVSYEFVAGEDDGQRVGYDAFAIDVRVWPGGETRRLARVDGHGNRMRWLGSP